MDFKLKAGTTIGYVSSRGIGLVKLLACQTVNLVDWEVAFSWDCIVGRSLVCSKVSTIRDRDRNPYRNFNS